MSNVLTEKPATRKATRIATAPFRRILSRDYHYPLLLALRDDDNAAAAIRITNALAERGAEPSVIEVTEQMLPLAGSPNAMVEFAGQVMGEEYHHDREKLLQSIVAKCCGRSQQWPVRNVCGDPAGSILEEARSRSAQLIVLGIHTHGAVEQAMGENTATRVMDRSIVPVLGVRSSLKILPRRILVAVDFGNASKEAAHLAANLADRGGTVVLVNVQLPYPIVEEGDEGAALVLREGVNAAFEKLSAEIAEGKRIRVERVLRTGDAGTQVISVAGEIEPDLIVVARQRHHLVTKLMLGSTSRRIVRASRWSVLVTPPLAEAAS